MLFTEIITIFFLVQLDNYLISQNGEPKSCFVGNEIILKKWIVFQGPIINCDKGLRNPCVLVAILQQASKLL